MIKEIRNRGARNVIIIVDANRSNPKGTGGGLVSSVQLPQDDDDSVFRLVSAAPAQISLNAPLSTPVTPANPLHAVARQGDTSSIFVRALISEMVKPRTNLALLGQAVRLQVSDSARRLGTQQTPQFSGAPDILSFELSDASAGTQMTNYCASLEQRLSRLRHLLAEGLVGRDVLDRNLVLLGRCGHQADVELLLLVEAMASGLIDRAGREPALRAVEPDRLCDELASVPVDTVRRKSQSFDIQNFALGAPSNVVGIDRARVLIEKAIAACEAAAANPRVPRYLFNLARAHVAAALVVTPIERQQHFAKALRHFSQAANAGYELAYNALAQLALHDRVGPTFSGQKLITQRSVAAIRDLLEKGSQRGGPVASYNIGLAYVSGTLGFPIDRHNAKRYLSMAAERGYVPAQIELALLIDRGPPGERDVRRVSQWLEVAAAKGSAEAMYRLAMIRDEGGPQGTPVSSENEPVSLASNRTLLWLSRAAEKGDFRAEVVLARMLQDGIGLPSPQPDVAQSYWRHSAERGDPVAQYWLASLIRDGKARITDVTALGDPSREVRSRYEAAFELGLPEAGLELAKLFESGDASAPGKGIPKNPRHAIELLTRVLEAVDAAAPDSLAANPELAVRAAHQILKIIDTDGAGIEDRQSVLPDVWLKLLRERFPDASRVLLVRAQAVGHDIFTCGSDPAASGVPDPWIFIWNWRQPQAPSDLWLDWWERTYNCKEAAVSTETPQQKRKIIIPRGARAVFREEYEASLKAGASDVSFVERMARSADNSRGSAAR